MTDAPTADGREHWSAVIVASIAVAVTMLDTFGVSQSLTTIGSDLGLSDTDLQWILNATTLSSAIALVPAGRAGDRWGRRRVAVGGLIIFAVGSGLGAAAESIGVLITARLVVGVGIAGVVASSLAIVTASVHPRSQARAIATWTAVTAAGGAIGPLTAGIMTEQLSWRWYLIALGGAACVMAVSLVAAVPETRDPEAPHSLDIPGIVTLSAGLGATIYGLMIIPEANISETRALASLTIGVVGLAAFVRVERTAAAPLLDLHLFLRRRYVAIAAVALVANWAYAVMIFYVPQYLQNVLNFSPTQSGAVFLLFTVPYGVLSLVVGKAQSVVRPFVLTAVGLCILVVAFVLAGLISVTQGLAITIVSLLVAAVGQSLVFNASGTQAMEAGGAGAGTASGALSTVRQLGFLLGLAVTGTITQVAQTWQLGVELRAMGFDLSWSDRQAITAGVSGSSFRLGDLPSAVQAQVQSSDLTDVLFVDGLRVGYWSVAGLCAVAVLAALASRKRDDPPERVVTSPRGTGAPG